jgi:hypothetical protein
MRTASAVLVSVVVCTLFGVGCKRAEGTREGGSQGDRSAQALGGPRGGHPDECAPGTECRCAGVAQCTKRCTGRGCNFVCDNVASCTFLCPEGGCTVDADRAAALQLHCEAGGCSMKCDRSGECTIAACKSGCSQQCSRSNRCNCPSGC